MPVILRPYQDRCIAEVRQALRDGHKNVLLQAPTGAGKCLGRGTPVLMFDGRVIAVEDVCAGDLLMGPDSKPRTVLSVCQGQEMLYRVTPTKGDAYVVNESHILSLRLTGGTSKSVKPGCRGGQIDGSVVNVGVLDYLAASPTFRHTAKGWRAAVDFEPTRIPLRLEPYFLGLWLGDGSSRLPAVCCGDPDTKAYLQDYAGRLGMAVRVEANSPGSENLYLIETPRSDKNRVTAALRADRVLGNKHVPQHYKTASRADRLALLAGIMDSDGYWSGKGYDLTLKSERLLDDVIFVARSLGFAAYKRSSRKTCGNNGVAGDYWRAWISGPVDEIPCLIPRKKAAPRLQKKDVLRVGINVEPIGIGDYFGFEIDGDRLFMLGDFTVTHNTIMAGYMLGAAADRGNDVWFICNRVELLDQTSKTFDKLGIRHSLIAPDYRPDYSSRAQIASIDTLKGRIKRGLVRPPKLAVFDECRSIAAAGWAAVHAWLVENGAKVIGLDATPERHDGKPLGPYLDGDGNRQPGFFQHLVHGPAYSELMALGNLLPFECYAPTKLDLSAVRMKGYDFDQAALEDAVDKPKIIGDIVDTYLKHAAGLRGLTFAVSRKHSEHLAEAYRAAGVPAAHVDGDTDAHERRRMVKAFRRGELLQLVNVDLFTAGFDVPGVRAISDAAPGESLPKTLQKWGRGSRPDEDDANKRFCYLFDHAGNLDRHGFPDDDRTWSLDGTPKQKTGKAKESEASVNMRQCEDCFHVHKPLPACPKCGFVYPIQFREVEEQEGELKKLSKDELRALREKERAEAKAARDAVAAEKAERHRQAKKARTLAELLELQRRCGYQNGWAEAVWRTKTIARDRIAQKIAEQQFSAYRR